MPLPTPDQLIELQRRLILSGSGSAKKYGTVDKVQNALRNQLKEAMIYGAGATVKATVTHGRCQQIVLVRSLFLRASEVC